MKKLFVLLFIIITLISCEKEKGNKDSIIGKWEWIMTSHGDFNYSQTPKSVDSTFYIEFRNNGYYYLYDNSNNQLKELKYELEKSEQSNKIKFDDFDLTGFIYTYSITNDTLHIWIANQIYPNTYLYKRLK